MFSSKAHISRIKKRTLCCTYKHVIGLRNWSYLSTTTKKIEENFLTWGRSCGHPSLLKGMLLFQRETCICVCVLDLLKLKHIPFSFWDNLNFPFSMDYYVTTTSKHTHRGLKTLVCYCYVKVLYVNTSYSNLTYKKRLIFKHKMTYNLSIRFPLIVSWIKPWSSRNIHWNHLRGLLHHFSK